MKRINFIILFILIGLLSACDNNKGSSDEADYMIYYIDSKTSSMVSESYTAKSLTKDALVNELIFELRNEPKNVVFKSAIPENIIIKDIRFVDDESLNLNFDSSYSKLEGIPEVLCRASIVKTLCQIEGIDYIEFFINDQPLRDSNGKYVGIMTQEEFISSIGSETKYKLSLYFSNVDGNELIEAKTNINYTGSGSIEEVVIEQLINGPIETGMYATIPKGTILLNITTKDGICYVDFNEKFLEKNPEIADNVAIYSVVNSLVELPSVNKVQFLINGKTQKSYREAVAFDGLFERNLSLIRE